MTAQVLPSSRREAPRANSRQRKPRNESQEMKATKGSPPNKARGGGAPKGAYAKTPRHAARCCHRLTLRARRRATNDPLTRTARFGRARLSAFRRGFGRGFQASTFRLRARFPGTRPCAGVARACLSQSSGSTPRAGRNAGGHDARSRPGAACEAARRHRPRPAIKTASGCVPSWVRNYFLIADLWWVSREGQKGMKADAVKSLK
jgi:hypothetical protein